jgi:hypothetical protein
MASPARYIASSSAVTAVDDGVGEADDASIDFE